MSPLTFFLTQLLGSGPVKRYPLREAGFPWPPYLKTGSPVTLLLTPSAFWVCLYPATPRVLILQISSCWFLYPASTWGLLENFLGLATAKLCLSMQKSGQVLRELQPLTSEHCHQWSPSGTSCPAEAQKANCILEVPVCGTLGCHALPWWLRWSKIFLQYRRPSFDPWLGMIPWRRAWQPTPVFLSGEPHWQRRLAGYSPWGCKESDTTEWLTLGCHAPFKSSLQISSRVPKQQARGPGRRHTGVPVLEGGAAKF